MTTPTTQPVPWEKRGTAWRCSLCVSYDPSSSLHSPEGGVKEQCSRRAGVGGTRRAVSFAAKREEGGTDIEMEGKGESIVYSANERVIFISSQAAEEGLEC